MGYFRNKTKNPGGSSTQKIYKTPSVIPLKNREKKVPSITHIEIRSGTLLVIPVWTFPGIPQKISFGNPSVIVRKNLWGIPKGISTVIFVWIPQDYTKKSSQDTGIAHLITCEIFLETSPEIDPGISLEMYTGTVPWILPGSNQYFIQLLSLWFRHNLLQRLLQEFFQ